MADARVICTDALSLIGKLDAGETMSSGDGAFALRVLGRMMDRWQAENLMLFGRTRTTWTISSGTQTYSVGSGSTVNVTRPVDVEEIRYIETADDPDTERPLDRFTDDGWAAVVQKAQTATLPTAAWYNATYPTGTITLWPNPSSSTLQGVLYARTALSTLASLNTSVSLPPAYEDALVKCLALELSTPYRVQVPEQLRIEAAHALAVLRRANKRDYLVSFDPAVLGRGGRGYNILTDE